MHFGKAIKIALVKKDKSQVWLANELGISRQAVSGMVRSDSGNTDTLKKIANSLGMQVSELMALGE